MQVRLNVFLSVEFYFIFLMFWCLMFDGASQVALMVKNLPTNAGDWRDAGSIPGSGRSPGEEHGTPLQYSCLENPRQEEPRGLEPMELQRVGNNWSNLAWIHRFSPYISFSSCFLLLYRNAIDLFRFTSIHVKLLNSLVSSSSSFADYLGFYIHMIWLS